ncbi:MAG: protein kinase domain-containing protein [Candidatus Sericytochromatia bacterium]
MPEIAKLPPLKPGMRIAGRYQLLEELGSGGSATVYRARDLDTQQVVALKHLALQHNLTHKEVETRIYRFQNEARTMAFLHHPHIMSVFDALELDGQYYMVMEFLEGMHLKEYMARFRPTVREVLGFLEQIAGALEYAHSRNVIHRDIKPENIMIVQGTTAKLLDFGIAKFEFSSQVTTDGTILGTVAYMSPEQLQSSRTTTHQSDIYSLGTLMYEVFTGRLPFLADSPGAAVVQIFSEEPTPPIQINPAVGPDLNQLILTCMSKFAPHRFASCRQVQYQFQALRERAFLPERPSAGGNQAVLPRIRAFEGFRFFEALRTLVNQQATGVCQVWNSFQEATICFEQGEIRQVRFRQQNIPPQQALMDILCWESGNFCVDLNRRASEDQFPRTSTKQLLQEGEAVQHSYQALWESYHDLDIPELIMSPSSHDVISADAQALVDTVDGHRCVGQLCALMPQARLALLEGLKELEDRQFVFVERLRNL